MGSRNWRWIGTREYVTANATRQLETIPRNPPVDLTGCTILITGASSGLGLESAKQIYDLRPKKLILSVRDEERGRQVKAELETRQSTEEPQCHNATIIHIEHLDQSRFSSVKKFVAAIENEKLDVVMLNIGMMIWEWSLTEDGYEKALQVNYLSTALLAKLLLSTLRREKSGGGLARPRLVFTSSDAHYTAPLSYANIPGFNHTFSGDSSVNEASPSRPILAYLGDPAKYDKYNRYLDTKLLLLLYARQLAAEVPASECIISSVHPGFISTRLFRDASAMDWISQFWPIKRLVSRTLEQGAIGMVYAAIIQGEEGHGRYISESKIRNESSFVLSEEGKKMQEELWKETRDALQEVAPLKKV